MRINFLARGNILYCRVTENGKTIERAWLLSKETNEEFIDATTRLVNDTLKELENDAIKTSMMKFYNDELLKNATVRWEKFKPLSEGVYPSACSRCKKNISTRIKDVIFNDPATIVFWNDGTKTVVKAENEPFDPEKGLAMAISKKFLGNKGNYFETFKKYIKEEE